MSLSGFFNRVPSDASSGSVSSPPAPKKEAAPSPTAAPAAASSPGNESSQPPPTQSFVEKLVSFCASATAGRAPSHGVEHMTKVRENAEKIFDALRAAGEYPSMMNDQTRRMVQAAAQFHDIADHKYVKDPSSCGVEEELRKHFSPKASASLVKVMEAVSFSKERKLRAAAGAPETPISFESTLGAVGSVLRDVVSDADKLEAIGSIGVKRCMAYKRESVMKAENREAKQEEVVSELIKHGEEKLFILLAHRYIRTSAGRKMAEPLQQIMLNEVCEMIKGRPDECQRLKKTYGTGAAAVPSSAPVPDSDPAAAPADNADPNPTSSSSISDPPPKESAGPLQSPTPNSASTENKTPGTTSATSKSSTSSSSGDDVKNATGPPAKRRKLGDGNGSYHSAANTAVVKNGVITGITKRERPVKSMTAEELAAQAEMYAK